MHKYFSHHQHFHHLHFKKFLHNKYNDLVIADTFRQVALSMISLFIPIYLIKIGIPIITVTIYELLMLFGVISMHIIIINYINRLGVKQVIILSYLFNTIAYFLLYYSELIIQNASLWIFLLMVGLFNVGAMAFYWTAHHVYFLCTTKIRSSGKQTGILMALPVLFGIIGPLMGAYLITRYSFHFAFLISSLLLMFASGALFFSKNFKAPKTRLTLKKVLDKKKSSKNLIYTMQGVGFSTIPLLWPLYMFYTGISILGIGFVYLLSAMANSIVCYEAGRETDKHGSRRITQIGTVGHGITVIFRAFITTVIGASIWQTLGGIFAGFKNVPLEASFYKHAHKDIFNSIINREFYLHIGRIIALSTFALLLITFPIITAIKIGLSITGINLIILAFVINKDHTIID